MTSSRKKERIGRHTCTQRSSRSGRDSAAAFIRPPALKRICSPPSCSPPIPGINCIPQVALSINSYWVKCCLCLFLSLSLSLSLSLCLFAFSVFFSLSLCLSICLPAILFFPPFSRTVSLFLLLCRSHIMLTQMNIFVPYGVATISRLLKIIGLLCKRALSKRWYSAKDTYNFKEPTHRSHPILKLWILPINPRKKLTVASREIETTVFDPASQFLSNISRSAKSFFTHLYSYI